MDYMEGIRDIIIGDFIFRMTSIACPEQYDVFKMDDTDNIVGYVRLRHGRLYAACPYVGGEFVYETYPNGDGCFDSEEERISHLTLIKINIEKWLEKNRKVKRG